MPIQIDVGVEIPNNEIEAEFSRASGPGGQHVNKTETRVTLRFALRDSPSIPEHAKKRMMEKLASRLTKAGEILVSSDRTRERSVNWQDAYERLSDLLQKAYQKPKRRRKTRPTKGSKERRLKAKRATADKKRARKPPTDE